MSRGNRTSVSVSDKDLKYSYRFYRTGNDYSIELLILYLIKFNQKLAFVQ